MDSILAPSTLLQNRYRILCLLGQGGMGAVYQAEDSRLIGRVIAVKENFDNSAAAQAQFQTEAGLLANLNHPALPRVTDYFIEPTGRQYLVMDYVEGDDLEKIVKRDGRVAETQAIGWMADVLNALEYLHAHQPPVIHRDIKPANIKIRPDGKVVLVDFGIAKVYDPTQKTRPGARAVTPGYSPTEQYGGSTDVRTDIYAVGATLYFILTGQEPPEATDIASSLHVLMPPSELGILLNPQIERAIMKAMAISPQYRFQTAKEFRDGLHPAPGIQPASPVGGMSPRTALASPAAMANPNVFPNAAMPVRPLAPVNLQIPYHPAPAALAYALYASWGQRACALVLDSIMLFLFSLPFSVAAAVLDELTGTNQSRSSSTTGVFSTLWSCTWYLLVPTYYIVFHTLWGQTIGKKALGIKVVRTADGRLPNLGWSFLRSIVYGIESLFALFVIGLIGFLWPLWDNQKQALHDKVAGTIVIRV